ncbi:MAG: tRNA (adenosine(37)-N6)-threonylcarbamoyltransferase complex transferase subunit TsaD [Candidatus Gracilibacteria bacterium]|nr:tRNA (adenosine(37)-N6)-threonylcarbamoyltransferase complex transferase subunit TsaD [Candidatus Gracilibacteria bacterium]
MIILAIETSCDDTSLAIFKNNKLLSMDTKSQIKIHNLTGGVVPEIAAREHANVIFEVLENVLNSSNISLNEIDYIAVTSYPGLIPSLLTGITVAKTLAKVLNKPLLELNHIEGHIFSNFLERKESDIQFPLVCLTVSGGHNDIYFMSSMFKMQKIGSSNDDAAGESYDKVAKMMGLDYPGGPIISKLAKKYIEMGFITSKKESLFPRVWLDKNKFDFSFSGLKSAVKREIDKRILKKLELTLEDKIEISFEFQNAVNEVLAYKLIYSALEKNVKTVMLAGGVSANDDLKSKIKTLSNKNNLNFIFPIKYLYSMDNAAMIGILAYYKIKNTIKY